MGTVAVPSMEPYLATIPECSHSVDGECYEEPHSHKGVVVFYHFQHCSESFINLPGINLLPTWLLAVMWGLFLIWAFFGVAVLSDAFVEGIEVITSKTRQYKRKDTRGNVVITEEPVWNWAVANITLLAVGASSPEILLALVETLLTLGQAAGEIGPSTIIGSGSYNLFGIIGICTLSLPVGVFKKIQHTKVFWWTTTWSLWAHIWLWLAYKKISPDVIEVWEALLTLGFMPIFVFTTYLVDTRGWNWFAANKNSVVPDDYDANPSDTEANNKDVDSPVEHRHSTMESPTIHSILYYRQLAVQRMAGGGAMVRDTKSGHHPPAAPAAADEKVLDMAAVEMMNKAVPKVLFKSTEVSVLESQGEARVQVMRMHGDMASTVTVHYTCKDDTAVSGLDYEPNDGCVVFGPGESVKEIVVKIVDDDMSEPDVQFMVLLTAAEMVGGGEVVILRSQVIVTIVDDDDGGVLMFELPTWEAGIEDAHAQVNVIRRNGADGRVTVDYSTRDGSAIAGSHFKKLEGTLVFNSGDTRQMILVPLLAVEPEELIAGMLAFRLTLTNPTGGVVLGTRKDCRILIVPGSKSPSGALLPRSSSDASEAPFNLWTAWEARFKEAILPEYDVEEGGNVWVAMLLHYISITFKLLAACVPPAEWRSGYPCFIIALGVLGALMAVVKEVAHMFGCAVGLSELMNGMSIVAMGTSLPDTFASRMAALSDDTADAAVGTVMGSNSVNVFLGLGIPWVIASLYYKAKSELYVVSAGALGFSIMIFSIFSVVAVAILVLRRSQGGELGGTRKGQWITFSVFIGLWLLSLVLTGLLDYGHISSPGI